MRKTVAKYSNKICEAIRDYYAGRLGTCHQRIENLVKGCLGCDLAVDTLNNSKAFPGSGEIQFFRARCESDPRIYEPKEMLHRPFSQRANYGNYRFSIAGTACLYLANTSYGCWIEMDRPPEHDFKYIENDVINEIEKIIEKYGFEINNDKSHYMNKKGRRQITGVVIDNNNNCLTIGNKKYKRIERQIYNYLVKNEGNLGYITGYLSHVRSINEEQYNQLAKIYKRYDANNKLF